MKFWKACMPDELTGLRVLVTRPAQQAGPLMAQLEAAGAKPWLFPLLDIVPIRSAELERHISQLEQYDLAIFISPNAVHYGVEAVTARQSWPTSLTLATVGTGSAHELELRLRRIPDIIPASGNDSEALLAESAMQAVAGKRILIFRGRGGREQLANTLRARGAKVDYAEVYERRRPNVDTGPLNETIRSNRIDAVVITSSEALDILLAMVDPASLNALYQIHMLVIHPRQAEHVRQHGFIHEPILAQDGSVNAIIKALTSLRASL
ncbi:MAG: uroporphyrinogen-III synthase [Gammaproteobacteria bacterium]